MCTIIGSLEVIRRYRIAPCSLIDMRLRNLSDQLVVLWRDSKGLAAISALQFDPDIASSVEIVPRRATS